MLFNIFLAVVTEDAFIIEARLHLRSVLIAAVCSIFLVSPVFPHLRLWPCLSYNWMLLSHCVCFIYMKLFTGITKSLLQGPLPFPEEQETQRRCWSLLPKWVKVFKETLYGAHFPVADLTHHAPLRQSGVLSQPQKWKIVSYSNLDPKKED